MSLLTVKMAKVVMESAYKYQFQIMSEIQNMKQILKWDGNGYCIVGMDDQSMARTIREAMQWPIP